MTANLRCKPGVVLFLAIVVIQISGNCQSPLRNPLAGEITGNWPNFGKCNIESITAKYRISTLAGQPTVFANIRWTTNSRYPTPDCLAENECHFFIKVFTDLNGGSTFYILADGATGIIPKADNTYGYNPTAGSPNWDKLLVKDGVMTNPNDNSYRLNFVSADQAKAIWNRGFTVQGIYLVNKHNDGYFIKKQ